MPIEAITPIQVNKAPAAVNRPVMSLSWEQAGLTEKPGETWGKFLKDNNLEVVGQGDGNTGGSGRPENGIDRLNEFCEGVTYRGHSLCVVQPGNSYDFAGVSMVVPLEEVCDSVAPSIPTNTCVRQMQSSVVAEGDYLIINGDGGPRRLLPPDILIKDIKSRINEYDIGDMRVGANTEPIETDNSVYRNISIGIIVAFTVLGVVLFRRNSGK